MKKSFFSKSVMTVLALAALTLSACAKKDDSVVRVAERTTNVTAQDANSAGHCANKSVNWGKIFDPNASVQFESQVKGFVSATMDPELLGSISGDINGKTGVDFCGIFKFDSVGNLVPSASAVNIKIFDSYAVDTTLSPQVPPYTVSFSKGMQGYVNHTVRQVDVTFQDDYGVIRFKGEFNDQYVQGLVYYQNKTAVSGFSPSNGEQVLGTFRVLKNSLIK